MEPKMEDRPRPNREINAIGELPCMQELLNEALTFYIKLN